MRKFGVFRRDFTLPNLPGCSRNRYLPNFHNPMSFKKTDSGSLGEEPNDIKNPYNVDQDLEAERVATNVETAYVVDHHAERALCRKFDFRLLPVLALMYLFNALDKGNLGNAKTDGLEKVRQSPSLAFLFQAVSRVAEFRFSNGVAEHVIILRYLDQANADFETFYRIFISNRTNTISY